MKLKTVFRNRLILYLVILFVISYPYEFLLIYLYQKGLLQNSYIILLSYFPVVVLLIMKFLRPDMEDVDLGLEVGNVKYYLIAILFPVGITYATAAIDKLIGIEVSFESIRLVLNTPLGLNWRIYLLITLFSLIVLVPFVNSLITIGEEIGFRGFILNEIAGRVDDYVAIIIIGFLWSLWKAPIVFFLPIFYFSGYPGIIIFVAYAIEFSVFLIWLRLKSRSILAPALASASLNAQIILGSTIVEANILFGAPISVVGIMVQSILLAPIIKNLRIEFKKLVEEKDIKNSLKETITFP